MSVRDKWVRRFSVDETAKHKNGFTIYKITSVLFPIDSPEAVTVVCVWKRYSDAQRLHRSMKALHAGLHLRGVFPSLPTYSFFKRFQQEVIEERKKTIKALLEFVAEHKLLFTSTDFVNFLQTAYPAPPEPNSSGVINAIRSSLQLPLEDTPPLEYQTDDEDRTPSHIARAPPEPSDTIDNDLDRTISQIPIYEAADVEIRQSPKLSHTDSFESINSLESINSDLYDELNKLTIDKKPKVLPDLINFDAPSTSKFDDYHTMGSESETVSLSSNFERSSSSLYNRSVLSLSNVDCKTKTEDSYVFEAGYILNLAARCEDVGDYQRAFECYKSGIEKMLVGVQTDTDPQRRALIKEKTNKYLSYAEAIYKNHLCDVEQTSEASTWSGGAGAGAGAGRGARAALPAAMLRRAHEELSAYRVLAVLAQAIMLVLHKADQHTYAMKVIQKIPHNLTEFDEYFLQRTNETRQPILPTVIPYMVPLHAYIETNNLIFLILAYAPGEKLFDYIKNYAKSIPNTPQREVNLENVFTEPLNKNIEVNSNTDEVDSDLKVNKVNVNNNIDKSDIEVNELVINSQKLLLNVDRVLSDVKVEVREEKSEVIESEVRVETPSFNRLSCHPRDVLPPSAICKWGAEILTAIESLHNSGVICRDLNPSNILLGSGGQIILTYMHHYPGADMRLHKLRTSRHTLYIAPELSSAWRAEPGAGGGDLDAVCDYWSFGAIMYQLLCAVPLSYYHRSVFTSHTILQLPEGLSVEVESLLTQLLTYDPAERLGAGKDGIEEIKRHPYFKQIDWQYIYDSWVAPD